MNYSKEEIKRFTNLFSDSKLLYRDILMFAKKHKLIEQDEQVETSIDLFRYFLYDLTPDVESGTCDIEYWYPKLKEFHNIMLVYQDTLSNRVKG